MSKLMKELQRLASAQQAARPARAPTAPASARPNASPGPAHPPPPEGADGTLPIYQNPKPVLPFGPAAATGHDTVEAPIYRDPADETLPFQAPTGGPVWTTRRYAELCAELGLYPDRRAEILAARGLRSDAEHRTLASEWAARLAADPRENEVFKSYCARFREHLIGKVGR